MGMIPVKCPNCGADIQLDDSREFGFCSFCGTKVMQDIIDNFLQKIITNILI